MKEYAINFESITTGVKFIKAKDIHEAYHIFEETWEDFDDISVERLGPWEPITIEGDDGMYWVDGEEPEYKEYQ
mgnify:CR=1 FL=1